MKKIKVTTGKGADRVVHGEVTVMHGLTVEDAVNLVGEETVWYFYNMAVMAAAKKVLAVLAKQGELPEEWTPTMPAPAEKKERKGRAKMTEDAKLFRKFEKLPDDVREALIARITEMQNAATE